MKIIEVSELSLAVGGKEILSGVSFGADDGELLCVVGRNGAGKSTLFKCICGLHKNFHGSVALAGRPLKTLTARERARVVAYVPQSAPTDVPYTVREFLEMSRYPWRGVRSARDGQSAVAEALSLAGLEGFASRRLSGLSGGELQRVMIASAIAQEPRAILMDEPTAFLDYAHQVETLDLMARVRKEKNVAMLLVTHDVNLAARLPDRALALAEGRLQWIGAPCELQDPGLLRAIFGVSFGRYFSGSGDARPLLAPVGA